MVRTGAASFGEQRHDPGWMAFTGMTCPVPWPGPLGSGGPWEMSVQSGRSFPSRQVRRQIMVCERAARLADHDEWVGVTLSC